MTRSAGALAFALTVSFGGTALASSARAANSSPSGGASLAGSGSQSASAKSGGSKAGRGASKRRRATIQTRDAGHVYPGDSVHMGDRILRLGMNGHDVRVLQDFLTRAGYATPVVGRFGPTTKANVIAFQRAQGLAGTGVVTWAVSQALRAAVAGAQSASQPSSQATSPVSSDPVTKATISNGLAVAPADAPAAVKAVIAAANRIAFTPYIYGGGHGSFNDVGYDCSGSVSYALHGGNLLSSPEDSSELESYGSPGRGTWITIWSNPGHVYMYVAGLRFDTGAQGSSGGSRWTTQGRSSAGYVERHPTGL